MWRSWDIARHTVAPPAKGAATSQRLTKVASCFKDSGDSFSSRGSEGRLGKGELNQTGL